MGGPLPIAGVQSDFRSGNGGSNVRAHEPPSFRSATVSAAVAGTSRPRSDGETPSRQAGKMPTLRESRLYLNILKNSSADLPGSSNKSDITATASAPASTTERAL